MVATATLRPSTSTSLDRAARITSASTPARTGGLALPPCPSPQFGCREHSLGRQRSVADGLFEIVQAPDAALPTGAQELAVQPVVSNLGELAAVASLATSLRPSRSSVCQFTVGAPPACRARRQAPRRGHHLEFYLSSRAAVPVPGIGRIARFRYSYATRRCSIHAMATERRRRGWTNSNTST